MQAIFGSLSVDGLLYEKASACCILGAERRATDIRLTFGACVGVAKSSRLTEILPSVSSTTTGFEEKSIR